MKERADRPGGLLFLCGGSHFKKSLKEKNHDLCYNQFTGPAVFDLFPKEGLPCISPAI